MEDPMKVVKKSSKKGSKKGSKKASKKSSKKAPKKSSKMARVSMETINLIPEDNLFGGKKSSKKSSKKASKKSSKKASKKSSKKASKKSSKKGSKKASKQKRTLPPALKESNLTNKYISQALGVKISPSLMKFIKKFSEMAKKTIKDEKDFMAINKKKKELFTEYLNKNGKQKIMGEIEEIAASIKKNKSKKGSKN